MERDIHQVLQVYYVRTTSVLHRTPAHAVCCTALVSLSTLLLVRVGGKRALAHWNHISHWGRRRRYNARIWYKVESGSRRGITFWLILSPPPSDSPLGRLLLPD